MKKRPAPAPATDGPALTPRRFYDGVFVLCEGCRRWGREGWAHACGAVPAAGGGFVSVEAVRVAEAAFRARRARKP